MNLHYPNQIPGFRLLHRPLLLQRVLLLEIHLARDSGADREGDYARRRTRVAQLELRSCKRTDGTAHRGETVQPGGGELPSESQVIKECWLDFHNLFGGSTVVKFAQ